MSPGKHMAGRKQQLSIRRAGCLMRVPSGLNILAALAVALCEVEPALSQVQTAKVTGGELQGVAKEGVASFKGIPFAAPPVGELRWKAPQPVKPWTGCKKAEAFAPGPMQDALFAAMMGGSTNLSEDCLYLNVWTPAKSANEKLPVMVWIYGGAFVSGLTSIPAYDGTKLARKGVVLVSVAYRVGPFGFLAHPSSPARAAEVRAITAFKTRSPVCDG